MLNYKETLDAMRRELASLQAEVDKLDQAISALQMLSGTAPTARIRPGRSAQPKKTKKTKRKIYAEGLKNIIDAQNKRWAKVRAAAKTKVKGPGKKASEPAKKT